MLKMMQLAEPQAAAVFALDKWENAGVNMTNNVSDVAD